MRKRKGIALLIALMMTAVMSVRTSVAAVGIENKAADVTVNHTIVGFGGYEWWVIGDADGGVYSQPNSVTLLSKNYDFGATAFRNGDSTKKDPSWTYYEEKSDIYREKSNDPNDYSDRALQSRWTPLPGDKWYYEGKFGKPNDYSDSTLQNKMIEIESKLPIKETGKINTRALTASTDGIAGANVTKQKLWPLSKDENSAIGNNDIRSYGVEYWLRSPHPNYGTASYFGNADGSISDYADIVINTYFAARPALNLNVSSVILTSDTKGLSKASAAIGGQSVPVTSGGTAGDEKIKYTFEDSRLQLRQVYVNKIEGDVVTVKYSGATADKTLSFIVKNGNETTTHYGKLAEKIDSEGEASFKLSTGFNGATDKIEVFVEEINGENESDFASEPKALDMTVKNMVTVNGGTGSGLYAKDSEVTLTANVPDGKYLSKWEITPKVQLTNGSLTNETIKFNMPDEDVTATAVYEDLIVYPIKDGTSTTWQQNSEGGLTITSEGDHSKFTGISVDGVMLNGSHYTTVSGSTVATLKASYLSTLSAGEHVLLIHFTDGYTETQFSIQAGQTTETTATEETTTVTETTVAPVGTSPKTSDSSSIWIIVSLMLGAGVGFMVVSAFKKSKTAK